jgi:hypothetical protein
MTAGVPGRPLAGSMRVWFLIDTLLVASAGTQLFVLATSTDRFFAWTIEPPVTAAFLGAGYWASVPLVFLASRQTSWANARIAVYGVWVFVTLTLITTLVHIDKFHLDDPESTARLAAWSWLVVYVVVAVGLPVLTLVQLRKPGGEPPRRMLLPQSFRAVVGVLTAAAAVVGVVLYVAPGTLPWPWPLSTLTSQSVGAWLIGVALIMGQVVWENDWKRVRIAMVALIVLGALYLIVLLVAYRDAVDWRDPLGPGLVVFAIAILGAGASGLSRARRAGSILTFVGPPRG